MLYPQLATMIKAKELILGYNKAITGPINLEIPDNKWIGVIGDNGTGKSTFLKTLLGMINPKSGTLKVFDQNCGKINREISYIPQEREIHLTEKMSGLSLIQNSHASWKWGLPILSKKNRKKITDLIDLVGVKQYVKQPFYTLSGGQKKRIFLIQALINEPKLILLDEPLADLDINAKQEFIKSLREIHQNQKINLLIVSHDMHKVATYLDGFIHFAKRSAHYCLDIPCIKKNTYV